MPISYSRIFSGSMLGLPSVGLAPIAFRPSYDTVRLRHMSRRPYSGWLPELPIEPRSLISSACGRDVDEAIARRHRRPIVPLIDIAVHARPLGADMRGDESLSLKARTSSLP